jgi:hypothetical protein
MINTDKLKKISDKPWFYPVALLLMGFITYGYVLTSLGFSWADWEVVMFNKLNPALQFEYYAHDRPLPWTYQLIYFLVGTNPIGWHIITLLIRWAGSLFFVQALILFWPRYKSHILWLGALLMFYPGFLQQSQSATKARHIMTLLLFALSLYLMALAIKRPNRGRILFPLSWLATFMHLFTTEYFAGLELIRPILLWILLSDGSKKNLHLLRRVAIHALPYLLITAFFFWCRFVYFPVIFQTTSRIGNIGSTLSGLQGSFPESLLDLFNRALLDLIYSTLQVWTNAIINLDGFTFQRVSAWFAFGLAVVLTSAFALFHGIKEEEFRDNSSPSTVFTIGFVSFVLAALPIWGIGKDISTGGWNDRFALAPMLGAGLMVMALLIWFVRPSGQKLILGFLLVFSIATQIWAVNIYRRDWRTQLDYYWQLYWRAPALHPGTAVFSYELPSLFVSQDILASSAINVLYHFQSEDGSLPYWFVTPESQSYFQPNREFKKRLRGLEFNGNTSNAIAVLHQTGDSCLRVLDSVYLYDPLFADGQEILIPVSNLSLIVPDSVHAPPDIEIFGSEPLNNWCYFFEKADLARQTKDWNQVLVLYDQAQQMDFSPNVGAEYIPFIEAYAQTGDWQKAYELTLAAQELAPGYRKMLCANWKRLSNMPSSNMKLVAQVDQSLSC